MATDLTRPPEILVDWRHVKNALPSPSCTKEDASAWGAPYRYAAVMCACVLLPATQTAADAIVVTKAMTASTIAEIFVSEEAVRIEVEIGLQDLAAFGNLLVAQR